MLLSKLKLGPETPPEYAEYIESKKKEYAALLAKVHDPLTTWQSTGQRVNWDTVAIETVVFTENVALVIAAIQEGTTFNAAFSSTEPAYAKASSYRGIRDRDHIEVCVTDIALIDRASLQEVPRAIWENELTRSIETPLTFDARL
jgi:hypothetical protein